MGGEDEVTKLKAVVARLEEAVKALSEQVAAMDATDPLPDRFDEAKAAATVDRLLGISRAEMSQDVQDLLWNSALRRLGVLTFTEYKRRMKVLLARDLNVTSSSSGDRTGGAPTGPAGNRSKSETAPKPEKGPED